MGYYNDNLTYAQREKKYLQEKLQKQEYQAWLEKAAAAYVEKRATADDFARGTGFTSAEDRQAYDELLQDAIRQEERDKAFLEGFMKDDNVFQAKNTRNYYR